MSRYLKNIALGSSTIKNGDKLIFNNLNNTFGVSISASSLQSNVNFKLPSNSGSTNSILSQTSTGDSKWVNGILQDFVTSDTLMYSAGTASQTATTITGVGTTFTSAMVGGILVWNNDQYAFITGFTNNTVLLTNKSQTVAGQSFKIYYGGTHIDLKSATINIEGGVLSNYNANYNLTYSAGTASQTATTITGVGTTFTSAMVGGILVWSTGQKAMITNFTNSTNLTAANNQTVNSTTFTIYYGGTQFDDNGNLNSKQLLLSSSSSGTLRVLPNSSTSSYTLTLPPSVASSGNQALISDISGNTSWSTAFLNGGNTSGSALTLGTNDNFGLNFKTNNTNVLSLDTSGSITGTGQNWTQNGVTLSFIASSSIISNYTTTGVTSFTIPANRDSMKVQLWGAGGGNGGGSGAYVRLNMNVNAGEIYWLTIGANGYAGAGSGGGGAANSNAGSGGQWTALFQQIGSNFILIACAGGGGGGAAMIAGYGGGGGNNGINSGVGSGLAGSGGIGGTGSGNGSNIASNATTTGISSIDSFGGFGGNGSSNLRAGGGGGYGGGGGGGGAGGGGNFVNTVVYTNIISSQIFNGNNGSSGTVVPPNETGYIAGYATGGGLNTSGSQGLAVVTLILSESGISTSKTSSTNLNFYNSGKIKLWRTDNSKFVRITVPDTVETYSFTLPTNVPVRNNQVLAGDTSSTLRWTDAALNGGNTLGSALTLGTNDNFGLNFKTNNTNVLSLNTSGNITGTGQNWTQNGITTLFIAPNNAVTSYSTPSVISFSTPNSRDRMRVQLWGAGGGEFGGSGAYVDVTFNVAVNATFWLLTGAGGSNATGGTGGNAGGVNASGGGGNGGGQCGGGGQYSALFQQIGTKFYLIACAGGGGGGQSSSFFAGGGGVNATGGGSTAGSNGIRGTGVSNGQNYSASALVSGETSLGNMGGYGANGPSFNQGAGGGGYGGGGSGTSVGSGGGNYAPAISGSVVMSNIVNGNLGNISGSNPPNTNDANYISGYGRGGGTGQNGGSGLSVITFYTTSSYVGQNTSMWMLNNSSTKYFRNDNAFGTLIKASNTLQSDYTLTLPATSPSGNGQFLSSDTNGNLSWAQSGILNTITTDTNLQLTSNMSGYQIIVSGNGTNPVTLTLPQNNVDMNPGWHIYIASSGNNDTGTVTIQPHSLDSNVLNAYGMAVSSASALTAINTTTGTLQSRNNSASYNIHLVKSVNSLNIDGISYNIW
jgi:hypothetical protein